MPNERYKSALDDLQRVAAVEALDYGDHRYTMVKDRIEVFRREYGAEFGIDTDVRYDQGIAPGCVIIATAKITDSTGMVIASGHSMEVFSGNPNGTIETAETKAIGRALACFGLHGGEYASGDEMAAVKQGRAQDTARMADSYDATQDFRNNPDVPHDPIQHSTGDQRPAYIPEIVTGIEWQPFIPDAPFNMMSDYFSMATQIGEEVEKVRVLDDLTRYWAALKETRDAMAQNDPEALADVKAAFATANRNLKG